MTPINLAFLSLCALLTSGEELNLETAHKIKQTAFTEGRVLQHLFHLTDVNGSRLTGSPGYQSAADWVLRESKSWGAENVHLEPWSDFGRGWTFSRFEIHLLKPAYAPLHGAPLAWCLGTEGTVHGTVLLAPLFEPDERAFDLGPGKITEAIERYEKKWRGKLAGKFVLLGNLREMSKPTDPASTRLDDKALADVSRYSDLGIPEKYEWPLNALPTDKKKRVRLMEQLPAEVLWDYFDQVVAAFDRLNAFFLAEQVKAILRNDHRGNGAIVFAEFAGNHKKGAPIPPPTIALTPEHFNRLARLSEAMEDAEIELNLSAKIIESPETANVIAEIPGGEKADEVVMLGGHLDSWHAGTGATDNAAGCAVAMEAFRILKTLDLKLKRTVRLALWSGEEQGLYGSRAYVREHFGDPLTMKLKPGHAKLSAYFNLDNGGGKIRGIHLQGNDMARPLFETWMGPFRDLGVTAVTIRDTGYTDHVSFDSVGLPGFQFLQDPLDYFSRTHHSDLDVADHIEPGDLMQASAVLAWFVYNAANHKDLIPRKPLPPPLPKQRVVVKDFTVSPSNH